MPAPVVAFCYSEGDVAFTERTWRNHKHYYFNEQNAVPTLRIYRRNCRLGRGLCAVKAVRDSTHKFEETGCTCDQPRSRRPSVPVETVAEAH